MLKNTYQVPVTRKRQLGGSFEFIDVGRLFGKPSTSGIFASQAPLVCVRSYGGSKIGHFRPKQLFDSRIGSYLGYHLAFIQIYTSSAAIRGV